MLGVDVMLNSLAGRHITLCLDALRPGGWHCVEGWHAGQAARRRAERRHRYTLSDYGLTEGQVDDAFSGYTAFTGANQIRMQ